MNAGTHERGAVETRALDGRDRDQVARLLDDVLGRGLWDLAADLPGSHRVALVDGSVVGVASACVTPAPPAGVALPGPVCTVRIVAVEPPVRGRGLATRLVQEVCAECEGLGAVSLLAFAWVHAPVGSAPLAGVLERLGFVRERRSEGFYASLGGGPCPACGATPCACPADVYVRRTGA